jgi:FSR family fosmidomycin resistance protein-like MFS transporter
VAAFHPQGARIVNRVAAHQKAMAMSIFGVGGTLGFAIGPGLITAAVLAWGMPGTAILALPTTLMAAVVAWHLGTTPAETAAAGAGGGGSSSGTRDAWGAFARLTSAVIFRAILFFGLNTFIPLYWINVLGQSKAGGATALTIFAATGVAGNLIGGRLSDRFGPVRVAVVGFAALVPLVPALAATSHVPTALALLAATGFALSASYSPTVILGQAYLPNHVGLSAGVTLGLAITIGGVATPLLGRVADHSGLWATLAVLAALPIFSTAFALSLPRPGAHPAARG